MSASHGARSRRSCCYSDRGTMSEPTVIAGEHVYLRPVSRADATPAYVGWLNDPETTRFMEPRRDQATLASVREYIDNVSSRDDAVFLAICLNGDDRHVGNVKLEPIDRRHRSAILGIMIGDRTARGRGIGTEATTLACRYAFETLGLHRVALGVTVDNLPAIRCYENVGFKREGKQRDAVRRGDTFIDSLWMAILEHELPEDNR